MMIVDRALLAATLLRSVGSSGLPCLNTSLLPARAAGGVVRLQQRQQQQQQQRTAAV
jgi:hypothetical protein